jgi:hypothetical protein
LDKILQKIADIVIAAPKVNGITVAGGMIFASGQLNYAQYSNFIDEKLKSKYIFVLGILINRGMLYFLIISKDLKRFASAADINEFLDDKLPIETLKKTSPRDLKNLEIKFKQALAEFVQSRQWGDSEI